MSKPSRLRLDQLLVARGLAESRARAQALVMAGVVFSGERRLDKPGLAVAEDAPLDVRGRDHPWVSRGGVKLAAALDHFTIDPTGLICLDVGASTGGFTDVLLSRGAAKIYAVDVGSGQLAWKLRSDPRVVVLEKTNIRNLDPALLPEPPALVVCDVSFIGLALALPPALALAVPGARLVALIKPQFEAGREQVGKGGIVRDAQVREDVCSRTTAWLAAQPGWRVLGLMQSPLTGADGNVEFLIAGAKVA
ncbi:MAG: TlyA family RNA methyltransferase [Rhodospirillales bacterium]|nr:TlyA family RNA methyltransferase [Rhodospirillales bacterium]